MRIHDIAFLELDRYEYVRRSDGREKEMTGGHSRRRPERNDESKHDWMTHESVKEWSSESKVGVLFASPVRIDLAQTKKIEVVDHERAQQHDSPAQEEKSPEH